MDHAASFRFYEELNDFLPPERRKRASFYAFNGTPSVKDAIENLGVPHTEVDLVLVDGRSVGFGYRLTGGERVSVYPVFESLDITPITRLRPRPLRRPAFVLDVHLGRLATYLRILGFDSLYRNDYEDAEIVRLSLDEGRIILTRDLGILKTAVVRRGYWLRSQQPIEQLCEVLDRFDLRSIAEPFSRCSACNGPLHRVAKESIADRLPAKSRELYDEFWRCETCGKLYWKGSHYAKLRELVQRNLGR